MGNRNAERGARLRMGNTQASDLSNAGAPEDEGAAAMRRLNETKRFAWQDASAWQIGSQDLPAPRNSQGECVHESKLFIYGGRGPQGRLNDLWCYDMDSRQWECLVANNSKEAIDLRSGVCSSTTGCTRFMSALALPSSRWRAATSTRLICTRASFLAPSASRARRRRRGSTFDRGFWTARCGCTEARPTACSAWTIYGVWTCARASGRSIGPAARHRRRPSGCRVCGI